MDGVVETESKNSLNEWVSDGEKNTAFLRLTWAKEEKVKKVWIFDRPNLKDQVISGLLVFSDGSTIKVSKLPNDGHSCKEILFPEKKITWMSFIIDQVSPSTENIGLAEIAVF